MQCIADSCKSVVVDALPVGIFACQLTRAAYPQTVGHAANVRHHYLPTKTPELLTRSNSGVPLIHAIERCSIDRRSSHCLTAAHTVTAVVAKVAVSVTDGDGSATVTRRSV